MKNLKYLLTLVIIGIFLKLGHQAFIKSGYLFEEFRSYTGVLQHSEDGKILYLNTSDDKVELEFAFDKAEDLYVEDWDKVIVKGFFSRFHGTLLVEEIIGDHVTFL